MKKFEHQIVSGSVNTSEDTTSLEGRLSTFGKEGWEIISTTSVGTEVDVFMTKEILDEP